MVEIKIQRARRGDGRPAAVVRVAGEVTVDNSPELRQALMGAEVEGAEFLVVDLARVPRLDSSGIATLVDAASRTRLRGGRFALSGLPERLQESLDVAGLQGFFDTLPDAERALMPGEA